MLQLLKRSSNNAKESGVFIVKTSRLNHFARISRPALGKEILWISRKVTNQTIKVSYKLLSVLLEFVLNIKLALHIEIQLGYLPKNHSSSMEGGIFSFYPQYDKNLIMKIAL